MASLKELKGRISSVKSTQKITKAKKMVAAARLRRAQATAEAARPYAERLAATVARLAGRVTGDSLPKLLIGNGSGNDSDKDTTHLLLVCAADRGLAGAFNANIVKAARRHITELQSQGKKVTLFLVGRKARSGLIRDYRDQIIDYHDTSAVKQPGPDTARAIAAKLFELYDSGAFDVVTLLYSRFESVLVQTPTAQQLIPAIAMEANISKDASTRGTGDATDYEPDEESILVALLPRNITMQIYAALLENSAGEQGASMTAMDNATRNAGDLITKLTIQYNRSRQAAITTELVEIISGAEAL